MKKTTRASKDAKIVNASDIVIKSKDNRKVSTIDKVAIDSVKGITTTKALTMLDKANDIIENETKKKGKAFYAIKLNEENFKEWFKKECDKEKKVKGVKYNQASNLANIWHYVWCDKTLNVYDSNKANNLVSYVKKDYAKVILLHNKGIISPSMNKADMIEILKKEFGGDCKTVKKASKENKTEETGLANAINTIEKLIIAYNNQLIKKGKKAKAQQITDAWSTITNAL